MLAKAPVRALFTAFAKAQIRERFALLSSQHSDISEILVMLFGCFPTRINDPEWV
jgi:hypothetical protein